ncbi:EAL domain-containing protein [Streptomyces sp. AC555_RSS877]|uniref:EAL domain-containing protein n=1 Tax=Streptomyces sp. AC555_RSS877 TaxID=2823688 RepID=UPI001C269C37|nr:EAL domain-containing protein [Streptomyces sp. AC555_RSS877]
MERFTEHVKSFVDELGRSPGQYALVEGITHLAGTLGLTVIAEGVENVRQQELLISMGCRFSQGYLFAEPVSAEEAEQLILAPPLGRLAGLPGAPAERKRGQERQPSPGGAQVRSAGGRARQEAQGDGT